MEKHTEEKALHDGSQSKGTEEEQQNCGVCVLDDFPILKNTCVSDSHFIFLLISEAVYWHAGK